MGSASESLMIHLERPRVEWALGLKERPSLQEATLFKYIRMRFLSHNVHAVHIAQGPPEKSNPP